MDIETKNGLFKVKIETKTSKDGKDYTSASVCQSVKNQNGEWEQKYFNCFPSDLATLQVALSAALCEYAVENAKMNKF